MKVEAGTIWLRVPGLGALDRSDHRKDAVRGAVVRGAVHERLHPAVHREPVRGEAKLKIVRFKEAWRPQW